MRIAVYGANGFQAGLVREELARCDLEAVPIGRDASRLPGMREAAGENDIAAALDGCDAVINCAGPFTVSGDMVVRAAITAGCHYVDTAGEQLFVKSVFDRHADDAARAGVTIVPAANDACVPVDLVASLLADRSGGFAAMTCTHFITGGGGPSRGSLRSLAATADVIAEGGLVFDGGAWSRRAGAFPLTEVVTIPRHVEVRYLDGHVDAALSAGLGSLTPEVIDALPVGPAPADRAGQRFTYVIETRGPAARGVIRGADTYGTTAVIAVQAARLLAAGGSKPGVLAPAQAFDPADFMQYLGEHGIRAQLEC